METAVAEPVLVTSRMTVPTCPADIAAGAAGMVKSEALIWGEPTRVYGVTSPAELMVTPAPVLLSAATMVTEAKLKLADDAVAVKVQVKLVVAPPKRVMGVPERLEANFRPMEVGKDEPKTVGEMGAGKLTAAVPAAVPVLLTDRMTVMSLYSQPLSGVAVPLVTSSEDDRAGAFCTRMVPPVTGPVLIRAPELASWPEAAAANWMLGELPMTLKVQVKVTAAPPVKDTELGKG